jgi:hypothetical protein
MGKAMDQRLIILLAVLLTTPVAAETESPFEANCTTSSKVQYPEVIPVPSDLEYAEINRAIQSALGSNYNIESGSYVSREITGEWFSEYQDDKITYAGLTVRNHYLQLAIYADLQNVTTIVCNSNNLKQKSRSIHRKVPSWKSRLDNSIRIELARAASSDTAEATNTNALVDSNESATSTSKSASTIVNELTELGDLLAAGLITEDEYNRLKALLLAEAN